MQADCAAKISCGCKHSVNSPVKGAGQKAEGLPPADLYVILTNDISNRSEAHISSQAKHKKESRKQLAVRIVSLALAVLMVLSVILAYVWQW